MKYTIVTTEEVVACHGLLSPDFWIRQRLLEDWSGSSPEERAMAVSHYRQQMATARSLREQAAALLDHARMIEADVAHLALFVREEEKRGKTREPDPDT